MRVLRGMLWQRIHKAVLGRKCARFEREACEVITGTKTKQRNEDAWRILTPKYGTHSMEKNSGVSVFIIHLKFGGRGDLGKGRPRRDKNWTVRLRAIKSIRTEQPRRKVNFLAYKPSHRSSVLWICKCLCWLAAPEEGTASLSIQSLASAPESYHSALGVINLSDDMPLRRLSKALSPKNSQALSGGSEAEGSGKPTTHITSM